MKMIKFTTKLFLILAATLLPTGVWGDNVVNVESASDFGETTQEWGVGVYYTLEHGKTYNLTNTIELQGCLLIPSGATITINLGVYDLDQKRNDNCVILNRGTLTLNGTGKIKNGHSDWQHYDIWGGGIVNRGTLNISDVTICNNTGQDDGGGIYNYPGGIVTINSGCISNNTNGAIYNQGTMTIKGGRIENHTVSGNNGCIENIGTLIIEGGSITGNIVANKYTGCILNYAGANLTIKGNPVIKNNTTLGGAYLRNIYLRTGTTITIGEGGLTGNDGDIGISMQTPSVFTSELIYDTDLDKFFSEDDSYEIVKSLDNKAKLRTLWDGLIERFAAGGAIELDKDYTAAPGELCLTVPDGKSVTLNLNGHTINRDLSTATDDGCVIKNIGTLTVNGTGIITGGKSSNGGGGIHNTGTLTVNGGSIRGNTTTTQGGGIYNAGILTIGGGTIENNSNTAGDGGGIYNSGSLTLNTGTISGNSVTGTSKNGGGIYNTGTLLAINGGTIQNNTATNAGGGIYHNGTTFNLQGSPLITGNTVNSNAGNVYLTSDHHTITITDALSNTTAIGISMEAPAVFTSGLNGRGTYEKFSSEQGSTVKLTENGDQEAEMMTYWNYLKRELAKDGVTSITLESGKTYQASSSDTYLHIPSSKTVTLNLNGQTINRKLNSATLNGCVIYNEGTLTITGSGTIKGGNNNDVGDVKGGGICNTGTLTINNGTIRENTTYSSGGGIYNTGTLTIQGGTITSNTATSAGGGIYHNGVALNLQGAPTISSNTVSSANNNLYLATGKTITVSGPLTNNTRIGITSQVYPCTFTTGLSGNGDENKFTADDGTHGIALNNAGNAIIGTKYTITRNEPNNTYTYMYIKGNHTANTIEAVAGEHVKVTISGFDGSPKTIPVSLYTTDEVLCEYPKKDVEYYFDMPDHNVTVTGLCLNGGYCGNANDEDIKYYLDGTTLRFQAKDASSYQMKNYVQNTVPWRDTSTYPYTNVDIPNNITHISDYAFYGSGLTATPEIPASVATIGTKAFGNCTHLTGISVDGGNSSYKSESGVLFNKTGSELICYPAGKDIDGDNDSYIIPAGVTTIAEEAFAYNTHLTTIPTSSVTTVGNNAFKGCTHLSSVTLTGLNTIGTSIFSGCSALATLYITGGGSLNIPGEYFKNNTYLQTVSLVNVATIGISAFERCDNLTTLTINGTTTIGQQAFNQCTSLSTISLAGVTTIGTSAFNNCSTLTSITIPSSVTSIDDNAFCWCSGLTTFHIPESVTTFGAGVFMYCQNLESITVHDNNPYYTADDGILYNKTKTRLICYPLAKTGDTYYVPTTVTDFDSYVFLWQATLKKIIFLHDNSTYLIPSSGGFMSDSESYKAFVKKGLKPDYTTAWGTSYSDRIFELDLEQATIEITGYDTYSDGVKYTDYDGNPKTPSVTVTLGGLPLEGKENELDTEYDYEITSYSNNTAIGTATVNITGHGDFAGTTGAKDFYITRKVIISGTTGYYSTYFNSDAVPLVTPSGLQANKVTVVNFESGTTRIEAIGYLPAGTPVLLYASSGNCNGTYHLKATTGDVPDDCSQNYIGKGEGDARNYESLMFGKTAIYVLRGDKFYRAYSGTLPANRCYIAKPTAGARAIPDYLEIGEGTTSIDGISKMEEVRGNVYYDLNGRRVLYPTKGGVYIYNGKKIVIK